MSIVEKVEMLRSQLGLSPGMTIKSTVDAALSELGLAAKVDGMHLVAQIDVCMAAVGLNSPAVLAASPVEMAPAPLIHAGASVSMPGRKVTSGDRISLRSWQGSYVTKIGTGKGSGTIRATSGTSSASAWTVHLAGGVVRLESEAGPYMHKPKGHNNVETWHTGIGNDWKVQGKLEFGQVVKFKSWENDYLTHKSGSSHLITSTRGSTELGWTVEHV